MAGLAAGGLVAELLSGGRDGSASGGGVGGNTFLFTGGSDC